MAKKFWLVGCGGVGSKIVGDLARWNKETETYDEIHLIDGDLVESGNLLRQDFSPDSIVFSKVDALKNLLPFKNGVITHSFYADKKKFEELILPNDENHIVLAVDNFKTRKLANNHFMRLPNAMIIAAANDYYDGNIQLAIRKNGVAITPDLTFDHPEIENANDKMPQERGCDELLESDPQLIFANRMAATIVLNTLWSYNNGTLVPFRDTYFDIRTGNVLQVPFPELITV